ncbi:MAG: DUF3499 domain-containing protein [Propionibacteriaceae bacterium]|nr:DUF3499 domain-containing protein [Propionibacteriaceae bacterium]
MVSQLGLDWLGLYAEEVINRRCTRPGCSGDAVATLTFSYIDHAVVIGPLAVSPEPATYDLCRDHAQKFRVPKGWEITILPGEHNTPALNESDVTALANQIRRVGLGTEYRLEPQVSRRKGHLGVVCDPAEPDAARPAATGTTAGAASVARIDQGAK